MRVPITDSARPVAINYVAKNFLIAPGKGLPVTLKVPSPATAEKKADK
jgi:hypothetical protein